MWTGWTLGALEASSLFDEADESNVLEIAPFQFDATPPMNHPLCGGWIKPVVAVDAPLRGLGFVLRGAGKPIVSCALDWTGVLNGAHLEFRRALAKGALTTPERVALQCVHQHNAPFVCLEAQRIVAAHPDLTPVVFTDFFDDLLSRAEKAVNAALNAPQRLTHVATAQARVREVASNRRLVDASGKLVDWRGSSSKNPAHHAAPEGLIDPWLKTVAFYNGRNKVAACHYYATHPMSYYGDGRVTSDFVGLARERRQQAEPDCLQIYFTGCAGNIAAGKYNDGMPEARARLTDRIDEAIRAAAEQLKPVPVETARWKTREFLPPVRKELNAEALEAQIANPQTAVRHRVAMHLAWLRRVASGQPIVLSALEIGPATLLHLPAESFVEYQLRAQEAAPGRFVATAAYGDGGPWYIPVKEAYPQGGYEVSVALTDPAVDDLLTEGLSSLVKPD